MTVTAPTSRMFDGNSPKREFNHVLSRQTGPMGETGYSSRHEGRTLPRMGSDRKKQMFPLPIDRVRVSLYATSEKTHRSIQGARHFITLSQVRLSSHNGDKY